MSCLTVLCFGLAFTLSYEDKELVEALTQGIHFWDTPSVQSALQKIITKPSSVTTRPRNSIQFFHDRMERQLKEAGKK